MNESGLTPKGYTLLVKLDEVATTEGILELTEERIAANRLAQQKGTVIAVGAMCWADEVEHRANPGDKILFRLYAGEVHKGADGQAYRILSDKDVYCLRS